MFLNLVKVVKPEVHVRRDTGISFSSLATYDLSDPPLIPGEVGDRKVGETSWTKKGSGAEGPVISVWHVKVG